MITNLIFTLPHFRTKTINKCFNLPEGKVECVNDTIEKLIKITSQVCDGEKYIQKCFTNAVAQCYQSQVVKQTYLKNALF